MGLQTANGNDSLVFVGKLAAWLPDPGVDGTPYWGHLANEASSAAAVNAYFDPNTAKVYGNRRRLAAGPPPTPPGLCALQLLPAAEALPLIGLLQVTTSVTHSEQLVR